MRHVTLPTSLPDCSSQSGRGGCVALASSLRVTVSKQRPFLQIQGRVQRSRIEEQDHAHQLLHVARPSSYRDREGVEKW